MGRIGAKIGLGGSGTLPGLTNTGALVESAIIRPTATTGTINDYAPTGFSTARYVFQDASGTTTLNGLAGGSAGRVITIVNISGSTINVTHENAGSTAENRFQTFGGATVTLSGASRTAISFVYDGTQSRWVQVGVSVSVFGQSISFNGGIVVGSTFVAQTAAYFSGVISPTAITGTVSDYAPSGYSSSGGSLIRQDASAAVDLTGLVASTAGREIVICNISTANTITLKHDVTSTAANRFLLPNSADLAIRPNGSVTLRYDATSARWRVIGSAA